MASESKLQTPYTGPPFQEDKEGSETLVGEHPIVKDSDPPSRSDEFPEGGLAAWATVFGSFLIQFCGFGYSTSFGVYQDFYAQHYLTNQTTSAISWIGSLNAFLVTGVGLVSGSLYDRGYFYHLVIAGSLLQSFSLFMLSLSKPNQYYQIFLAQGLGSGIATGLMFVPSTAVIAHYFRRKRTLVLTFVASGSSLGATIHPIMLNNLLSGPLGFANAIRASAGLVSALLLIACLCMRTRLDPPTTTVNYTAAARKCIRDIPFILMIAGGFFFQIGLYYPMFFLQLDSIKHGISVTFSFYSLVILNVSNCAGRVTSGFIAAYTGVPNLTIVATISCGVLNLGLIGLRNLADVVVLGVLYGYFAGLYIGVWVPLMANLTPDLSELGARMGICFFMSGFGTLIGTPISGALLTSNYTWWIPSLFSGVIALVGSMMYIIMRLMLSDGRSKKRHSSRLEVLESHP
ncbi:major facilitator superfamily domain-containing protein [Suillus paluster]|uniref:major facilitator superfamily domain-containing protein n=1 Tax=Suillus paluster TaxID=48578 RepID=UPI001B85E381|nr:major facilitator superfamily domain-containing protein [Suillus paluster]KAG1731102.1 major facilitator superfamily domain-containing protein [Suillus paluster]